MTDMKHILLLSILLCAVVMPSFAELTDADLDKIRLIIHDENTHIKSEITSLKQEIALTKSEINTIKVNVDDKFEGLEKHLDKRFEGIEKNFDRQNNLIIACIAVPMALIAILVTWRSIKDSTQQKEIDTLKQEIETLKQQRVVSP